MRALALFIALAIVAPSARADDDADTQAAKHHFDNGLELYGLEHYGEAVREFEQARAIKPLPAFDYNIGRCYERMEHWADAIAAYERFLSSAPAFAPQTSELRERIGVLRGRVAHPRRPQLSTRRALRLMAPISLGVGLAAIAAGTGAYLSVYPDYADAKAACGPHCPAGQVTPLWTRVERAQTAGVALWSIGGALALVSAPLFVLGRETEVVRVAPMLGSDGGGVTFSGTIP